MRSRIHAIRRRMHGAGGAMPALIALATLAACESPRQAPAKEAIAQIESAVADAGTAPSKYIPGDLQAVETQVARLKRQFEHGHYQTVLRDAPAVLAQARALETTAAARAAELLQSLQDEWLVLARDVPGALESTRERLQVVERKPSAATRPSQEQLAQAAKQIDTADALWRRAVTEHDAQRLPEAVTLAGQARELVRRVDALPGVAAPAAAVQ